MSKPLKNSVFAIPKINSSNVENTTAKFIDDTITGEYRPKSKNNRNRNKNKVLGSTNYEKTIPSKQYNTCSTSTEKNIGMFNNASTTQLSTNPNLTQKTSMEKLPIINNSTSTLSFNPKSNNFVNNKGSNVNLLNSLNSISNNPPPNVVYKHLGKQLTKISEQAGEFRVSQGSKIFDSSVKAIQSGNNGLGDKNLIRRTSHLNLRKKSTKEMLNYLNNKDDVSEEEEKNKNNEINNYNSNNESDNNNQQEPNTKQGQFVIKKQNFINQVPYDNNEKQSKKSQSKKSQSKKSENIKSQSKSKNKIKRNIPKKNLSQKSINDNQNIESNEEEEEEESQNNNNNNNLNNQIFLNLDDNDNNFSLNALNEISAIQGKNQKGYVLEDGENSEENNEFKSLDESSEISENEKDSSEVSNKSLVGLCSLIKGEDEEEEQGEKTNSIIENFFNTKKEKEVGLIKDLVEYNQYKMKDLEDEREVEIQRFKSVMGSYFEKIIGEILDGTFKRKKKRIEQKKEKMKMDNNSEVLDKSLELSGCDFSMSTLPSAELNKSHDTKTFTNIKLMKNISNRKYFIKLKELERLKELEKERQFIEEQKKKNELNGITGEENNDEKIKEKKEMSKNLIKYRNDLIFRKDKKSFIMSMKIIMYITSLVNLDYYYRNSDLKKIAPHFFRFYFFDHFIYIKLSTFVQSRNYQKAVKYKPDKNNFHFCLLKFISRDDEEEMLGINDKELEYPLRMKKKNQNFAKKIGVNKHNSKLVSNGSRNSLNTINTAQPKESNNTPFFKKDMFLTKRPSFLNRTSAIISIEDNITTIPKINPIRIRKHKNPMSRELTKEGFILKTSEILQSAKLKLKTRAEKLFCLIREKNFEEFEIVYRRKNIEDDPGIPRDKDGNTLLIFAVKCNAMRIVDYLIEHGEDINAKNNELNTPLHIALHNHNYMMADLLIKNQADESAINGYKMTPWEYMLYDGGEEET